MFCKIFYADLNIPVSYTHLADGTWSLPEGADPGSGADEAAKPSGSGLPDGAEPNGEDVSGAVDSTTSSTPCAEIIHRDQEAQSGGGDVKRPSSFDYRKMGRAPQIGNQGSLGTCWAFASLKALESSLLPGKSLELSVDHMTMHNSFSMSQDAGGEYTCLLYTSRCV